MVFKSSNHRVSPLHKTFLFPMLFGLKPLTPGLFCILVLVIIVVGWSSNTFLKVDENSIIVAFGEKCSSPTHSTHI
jgi:hypothetical protein